MSIINPLANMGVFVMSETQNQTSHSRFYSRFVCWYEAGIVGSPQQKQFVKSGAGEGNRTLVTSLED